MRMDTPRVPPLAPEAMDEETRARFGDGPILAIFRTLAHHPIERHLRRRLPARRSDLAQLAHLALVIGTLFHGGI